MEKNKVVDENKKSEGDRTVGEVFEGIKSKLSETEMNVIYAIIGSAAEGETEDEDDNEDGNVSIYASKIINEKNKIISTCVEPRDLSYLNINGYKNVCAVSYSGNNYGVDLSFNNNLKHYLHQ